jgi:hypothetical protein
MANAGSWFPTFAPERRREDGARGWGWLSKKWLGLMVSSLVPERRREDGARKFGASC